MRTRRSAATFTLASLVVVLAVGCAGEQEPGILDDALAWMTGSFSSAEQASADSSYYDIRLEMVPIWTDRDDGPWLYVEQAVAAHRERPYRQRVYHLVPESDAAVRSEIYTLPRPMRFAGAHEEPDRFAALSPDSLTHRAGCDVLLRRGDAGALVGGTQGRGCSSAIAGAAYATSEITLSSDRLVSWDRGFDEGGAQVWGAREGGYVLLRVP